MAKMLTRQQQDDIAKFVRSFGLIGQTVGRMELAQLRNVLIPKEKVEAMIYGVSKGAFVMMVATNERLHFIDRRWFNSRVDDYEYSRIESVEYDMSLLSGMVKILAAQGTVELKFAPNRLLGRFVRAVEAHIGQKVKANGKSISDIDKLERLSMLRKSGDLTQEEFEIEKSKIIRK